MVLAIVVEVVGVCHSQKKEVGGKAVSLESSFPGLRPRAGSDDVRCLRPSPSIYHGSLFCRKVRYQMSPDRLQGSPRSRLRVKNKQLMVLPRNSAELHASELCLFTIARVFWRSRGDYELHCYCCEIVFLGGGEVTLYYSSISRLERQGNRTRVCSALRFGVARPCGRCSMKQK